MTLYNPVLKEKIGVEFEFKASLVSYLESTIENEYITNYDEPDNSPALRQKAVNRVRLTTPAMKFEYKAGAYGALKLINDVLLNTPAIDPDDKELISSLLNLVYRYVGMEGEDGYHFMVAVFRVAEAISAALDNAAPLMAPAPTPIKETSTPSL